jgi:hypothetical protein
MSPNITDHLVLGKVARITGGVYLAYILASVLADMLGHIRRGDAQQVYQAIVTDASNAIHYPGLVVSFFAEVGLALWLLAKGVKVVDLGAGPRGEKRLADPQAERWAGQAPTH